MNLNDLTIGEAKQLATMFGSQSAPDCFGSEMIGKKVIIRTYSAGVWFGTLDQKAKSEVILKDARRMWKWWAAESISLSAVSIHGVRPEKSKIAQAVESVWLEAIEIIPCEDKAIKSIEGCENAAAS